MNLRPQNVREAESNRFHFGVDHRLACWGCACVFRVSGTITLKNAIKVEKRKRDEMA